MRGEGDSSLTQHLCTYIKMIHLVQGLQELSPAEKAAVETLGWSAGRTCYSTINFSLEGKEIVPGSKGRVMGPCSDPADARAEECVLVQFENGLIINMFAKSGITRDPQVRAR